MLQRVGEQREGEVEGGGGSVTQEFTLTVLYLFGLLIFYRKDNMFAWAGFINIPPSTHLLY